MKRIYKTTIVLDPNPKSPVVSSGKIKTLHIFPDHIRIGRDHITYDQIMTRRIQDSCIVFWQGEKMIRFAVQGFGSKGTPDPSLTVLVNQLIDSVESTDDANTKQILNQFTQIKRTVALGFTLVVGVVILLGASFGVFHEFFIGHPIYILIYPIGIFVGLPLLVRLAGLKMRRKSAQPEP